MAIAAVLDFEGATLDQYDQVVKKMGFSPQGKASPGLLFHWVTKTDGGVRVTDVWDTKEQFESFAQEKIGPISAEVGMPEPSMSFLDVHNYLTAG
jgi:hypothetical protein